MWGFELTHRLRFDGVLLSLRLLTVQPRVKVKPNFVEKKPTLSWASTASGEHHQRSKTILKDLKPISNRHLKAPGVTLSSADGACWWAHRNQVQVHHDEGVIYFSSHRYFLWNPDYVKFLVDFHSAGSRRNPREGLDKRHIISNLGAGMDGA